MVDSRYTPIPVVPPAEMSSWQYEVFSALKENVELLTGLRGEEDGASIAVSKSSINTVQAPEMLLQGVSAQGAGYTIEGASVPSSVDHNALISDVKTLVHDVASIRATLNALITDLRR